MYFYFTEVELPKASNTSTLSGAGMLRFLNKIGETVNKITYKMDGYDSVSKLHIIDLVCSYVLTTFLVQLLYSYGCPR